VKRLALLACCALTWLLTLPALARVERFAVVIGNDLGLGDDQPLRYAETDARRVLAVLRELGGVEPANAVLLAGESADVVRRTLITVNDRIRSAVALPDTEVVLMVYYSGHADAEGLHLAGTRLDTRELAGLVRGSSATFRLLVVDACRSGALTRVKGGTLTAPFDLVPEPELRGQGLAFLTASADDEDAQESDALGSSFFTHALVSGLLGAADRDGDGAVGLEEAYRYSYDATVRATSRTFHGTQHPRFHYDLRGQGSLALTETRGLVQTRGRLRVGARYDTLVLRGSSDGPVVAELALDAPGRSLSLAAGSYFVRVRTGDHLREGVVEVSAGGETALDPAELTRVDYGRLVRKGGSERRLARALELGATLQSALPNAETPCAGGALALRADLPRFSLTPTLRYCRAGFDNAALRAHVHELGAELRVSHAWDLRWLTVELGASLGASLFVQDFETRGLAPTRRSAALRGAASCTLVRTLRGPLYVLGELSGAGYVLPLREEEHDRWRAALALAGRLALGVSW
jgi:Caspase domain